MWSQWNIAYSYMFLVTIHPPRSLSSKLFASWYPNPMSHHDVFIIYSNTTSVVWGAEPSDIEDYGLTVVEPRSSR